jgi:transketolase
MAYRDLTNTQLNEIARYLRRDVLVMVNHARSGHPGGPLSGADYLTTLYFKHLRVDPKRPDWPERDRAVISNGHCSALNYAMLARLGFLNELDGLARLLTFRATGSRLQGHPNRMYVPGLEFSTGSLGQGLSAGFGMALGARMHGYEDARVFVNLGDGELQEGAIWEAAMSAGHYRLDNLIAMVDANDAQIDGRVSDVMSIEPLADKFTSFGWRAIEADGHDFDDIERAFDAAFETEDRPSAIIFRTRMMHGCPSFEDDPGWHGRPPTDEQMVVMLQELGFEESLEETRERYKNNRAWSPWDPGRPETGKEE